MVYLMKSHPDVYRSLNLTLPLPPVMIEYSANLPIPDMWTTNHTDY